MPTQDDIITQVRRANERFYRAMESLDIDIMASMWVQSDRAKCIHPGWDILEGWEAVHQSWQAIFANTDYMRFVITDAAVHLYGHVAWVTCVENLTQSIEARQMSQMLSTNIYELSDDNEWYIVHHHASPILRQSRAPRESDPDFLN